MKPLFYVLLASLWVEPRSGYDLSRWFDRAARHYWAADHSSIYPALASLKKRGLVRFTSEPSERGPKRKVYHLTDTGQDALRVWLKQPPAPADVHDEQLVKALALDLLPLEEALAQLAAARETYRQRLEAYQALLSQWDELRQKGEHPAAAKVGPRLTLMRGVQVQQGYLRWCDEATALLKSSVQTNQDT